MAERRKSRGCGCCGGCPGCLLILALIVWALLFAWHAHKPLPDGLRMQSPPIAVPASDINVLADVTAVDGQGQPVVTQTIFDRMLGRIGTAGEFVLVDSFFFSAITGSDGARHRELCSELTQALISAKSHNPDMPVVVITDPINTIYGGQKPLHFRALRQGGVTVIMTDLTRLRDSNPVYSAWWRLGPRWFGKPAPGGLLPNPFSPGGPQVGFRSWLSLLNFKANHRKVVLTDDGRGNWGVIVGSLNAHDGSSNHSNLAVEVTSTELARQLWASEAAVITMSGATVPLSPFPDPRTTTVDPACRVNLLTEGAIRDAILADLEHTGPGDTVDAAFFYLSHRGIRRGLIEAAERGAEIRLILDPSKDAFGRTKSGVPNRQAALGLMTHGRGRITVRWYDTHGEQFHPKAITVRSPTESTIIMGSANMTRRNLDDYNLETDIRLQCPRSSPPDAELQQWFDRLWFNEGVHATVDFEVFEDRSLLRRVQADFQERTGMGTF
ncbi:MAG: phospholipase D-like domain-containing protein [Acidobacteriota bacterium]